MPKEKNKNTKQVSQVLKDSKETKVGVYEDSLNDNVPDGSIWKVKKKRVVSDEIAMNHALNICHNIQVFLPTLKPNKKFTSGFPLLPRIHLEWGTQGKEEEEEGSSRQILIFRLDKLQFSFNE